MSAPAAVLAGPRRPSRLRRAARGLERILAVTGALLLVYQAGFSASEVISPSMAPTLRGDGAGRAGNDWILCERLSTRFGPPPRFSLLLFENEDGVSIAKRVVGYPGEEVGLTDDGRLVVDGRRLDPPPGARWIRAGKLRRAPHEPQAHRVEDGAVFLLGDHGADSWDSRFFGGLERERWRGRVVAVVWPPSRWSWLW